MGRPSRKRPRPQTPETSNAPPRPTTPLLSNSQFSKFNIATLVSAAEDPTRGCSKGTIQQVWGAVSDADLAASPNLVCPERIELDHSSGVAWLLNTRRRLETQTTTSTASFSAHQMSVTCASLQSSGKGHRHTSVSQPSHSAEKCERSTDVALKLVATATGGICLCDRALREELLRLKREFDDLTPTVFKRVRSACNPAEALSNGPFLNRSAMKLANIDAIVQLLAIPSRLASDIAPRHEQIPTQAAESAMKVGITDGVPRPRNEDPDMKEHLSKRKRPETERCLLFADLCGGPGGFSEYIFRKRQLLGLSTKGWGISLRARKSLHMAEGFAVDYRKTDEDRTTAGQTLVTIESEAVPRRENDRLRSDHCREACPGGDQDTAPIVQTERHQALAETRDGVSANSTDGVLDEHYDPCAWRFDRLATWCDVTVVSRHTSCSITDEGQAVSLTPSSDVSPGSSNTAGGDGLVRDNSNREVPHDRTDSSTGEKKGLQKIIPDFTRLGSDTLKVARSSSAMRIDYGPHGTGDLMNEANIWGFVGEVLASSEEKKLDIVMADGGFGSARDVEEQERLVSPLLHCEALTALLLLAEGGSFVCKLFEVWSESTAALVYALYRKFQRIAIVKPITSRPASGERYLVCKGKLATHDSDCPSINHMLHVVQESSQGRDPTSLSAAVRIAEARLSAGNAIGNEARSPPVDMAAEMKRDLTFMWFLRWLLFLGRPCVEHPTCLIFCSELINDSIASVQAEACARIVDVASSRRGRAWAFRRSQGNSALGADGEACRAGAEADYLDEWSAESEFAALKSFWNAWSLNTMTETER